MHKQSVKNPNRGINIYDFDKTIYAGDCSLDFYIFSVNKNLKILVCLPIQLWHFVLFIVKLETRTNFKSHFFVFLKKIDNPASYVDEFWAGRYIKVQEWYQKLEHSKDVIISASPEFLLQPAFERLGAHALIATRMDMHSGEIKGENCRGQEKVYRLHQELGYPIIRKAYSDSLSDLPILTLAEEGYIVKGDKIIKLREFTNKVSH